MTLYEMGAEYRASAEKVREQLKELRKRKKEDIEPAERADIEYKISVLTPILTDLKKTAERCEQYYGVTNGCSGHCDEKRLDGDRRRTRRARTNASHRERILGKTANDNAKRIDRDTARNGEMCTVAGYDLATGGRLARSLQKYGL